MNFQRGKSPKEALDLGGWKFETLRPGSILIATKSFGVTQFTGMITGPFSARLRIHTGNYLIVEKIKIKEGKKTIYWIKAIKKERAHEIKDEFISFGKIGWKYGQKAGFLSEMTARKFNFRLKIITR